MRRRLDKERRGIAAPRRPGEERRANELALANGGDTPARHGLPGSGRSGDAPDRDVAVEEAGTDPGASIPGVAVAPRQHDPSRPASGNEKPAAVLFDSPDRCRVVQPDLLALVGGEDRARPRPAGQIALDAAEHDRKVEFDARSGFERADHDPRRQPADGQGGPVERRDERPREAGEIGAGVDAVEHLELVERVSDDGFGSTAVLGRRKWVVVVPQVAAKRRPRPPDELLPAAQSEHLATRPIEIVDEIPQRDRRRGEARQALRAGPRALRRFVTVELPLVVEGTPGLLGDVVEVTAPHGGITSHNPGEARDALPVADRGRRSVPGEQRRRTEPGHDGGPFESPGGESEQPGEHLRRRQIGGPVWRRSVPADPGLFERPRDEAAVGVA